VNFLVIKLLGAQNLIISRILSIGKSVVFCSLILYTPLSWGLAGKSLETA
jgi:hypothetical protein